MPIKLRNDDFDSIDPNTPKSQALLAMVEATLRRDGDLGVYGDLRPGLAAMATTMEVELVVGDESVMVLMSPDDGEPGHHFSIEIDRRTGEIIDSITAELAEEPEDWECSSDSCAD